MGTIVVTGAAGALGQVVVETLVARGDCVAAVGTQRSAPGLRALVDKLGRRVSAVEADAASASDWARALPQIEAELGAPDGAVLIAGAWAGGVPLHAEADDTVWRTMMNANLETAHASLRALLGGLVTRRRGSIVVIGSRAAARPWTSANASAYAASKAALVALAQAAAAEVLDSGVRINAVLPSVIDTPANRRSMPDGDPSGWVSSESLAAVIAFLLSDGSRDISGATIPVYGRA